MDRRSEKPHRAKPRPAKPNRREPAEASRATVESELARDEAETRECKIDDAVEMTFPASDPPAPGHATSTEPPARPPGRRAPVLDKAAADRAAGKRD